MKSILIVTKNDVWGAFVARELSSCEVTVSSHEDAMVNFFTVEPDLVLVCEYENVDPDKVSGVWTKGFRSYADIKLSAGKEQKVFRCGFVHLEADDFIQLPLAPKELLERL